MSSLPNSNREVAEEWLRRAAWRHSTGVRAVAETGDTTEAVRDLASAAELALKAVYIKLGSLFPRSHNVSELVEECPDRTVLRGAGGILGAVRQGLLSKLLGTVPTGPAGTSGRCRGMSTLLGTHHGMGGGRNRYLSSPSRTVGESGER